MKVSVTSNILNITGNAVLESTSDTADIASLPTVDTIIVSTIPIREFRGINLAIVSNKVESAVQTLNKLYFPQVKVAVGDREGLQSAVSA